MFKTFFYQPLFNLLVIFYNFFHDLGFSAVFLVVLVRTALWPLFTKNEISQKVISKIQPQVVKIQKENGKDYQTQSKQLLALYKAYNINPSFTMLFSIIQIFFILALYNVFKIAIEPNFVNFLYPFLKQTTILNPVSMGIINLSKQNLILAILASGTQLIQGAIMIKNMGKKDPQRGTMMAITFIMPFVLLSLYNKLPSIVFLY